jgi:hypothetical protein
VLAASSQPWTRLIGYSSTRGDMTDIACGSTAGCPILQLSSGTGPIATFSVQGTSVENVIFDANGLANSTAVAFGAAWERAHNLLVKGFRASGVTTSGGSYLSLQYSEITNGLNTCTNAVNTSGGGQYYRNYIHDMNCTAVSFNTGNGVTLLENIFHNFPGATSDAINAVGGWYIVGNTIDGAGRHGINVAANLNNVIIQNNLITNSGHSSGTNAAVAYGISATAGQAAGPWNDGNAFYNNLSGNRFGINDQTVNPVDGVAPYGVQYDTSISPDPYGGTFPALGGAGASALKGTGVPRKWPIFGAIGYPDFGAVQAQGASGQRVYSCIK